MSKEKTVIAKPATDIIGKTLTNIKNVESTSASCLRNTVYGYYLGYIIRNKTPHVVVFGRYEDISKAFVIRLGPAFPLYVLDSYNLFELIRISPVKKKTKDGNSYMGVNIDSMFKFCNEDDWKECLTNQLIASIEET